MTTDTTDTTHSPAVISLMQAIALDPAGAARHAAEDPDLYAKGMRVMIEYDYRYDTQTLIMSRRRDREDPMDPIGADGRAICTRFSVHGPKVHRDMSNVYSLVFRKEMNFMNMTPGYRPPNCKW